MVCHPERAAMLAARVSAHGRCAGPSAATSRVAMVLFNFPPNAGAAGTAAYLAVFASLHNVLTSMQAPATRSR